MLVTNPPLPRLSSYVILQSWVRRCGLAALVSIATLASAQSEKEGVASTNAPPSATNSVGTAARSSRSSSGSKDLVARIRDEGLNRSEITNTLTYLTEVFGPRLTASPAFKRSAEWARRQMETWGLSPARLESWGPFGRGWSLKRFSAQIVEPHGFPLTGHPFAWSPGLTGPITADVVLIDAKTEAELEAYRGKLTGAVALISSPRDVRPRTEPEAYRLTDANLLQLANLGPGRAPFFSQSPSTPLPTNAPAPVPRRSAGPGPAGDRARATNSAAPARTNAPASRSISSQERLAFAHREGAAAVMTLSSRGSSGGLIHVESASVPPRSDQGTNGTNRAAGPRFVSAWATNAPAMPPQVQVMAEDYNRMVRMLRQGEKLRMNLDLQVQFHDDDLMGYNVIAEIPGTDLKDEVVMLGGHLDSWHSGTGATDNAAGVAVAMEAVRVLQAVNAKPRRTIRVALWGGEEQGLYGSKAYVSRHFGYYTNITNVTVTASLTNGAGSNVVIAATSSTNSAGATNLTNAAGVTNTAAVRPTGDRGRATAGTSTNRSSRTTRTLIRHPDYEHFSVYFNLDNGTGKIRGVYLQGNEAARPLFRKWLEPFRDLGAETLSLGDTSATDHMSFDAVGLPGFQFIQDPVEYWSRTHHSNMDVYDRLQIEELKQAATIMAACVYQAAMLDEKMPRKSLPPP